MNAVRNVPSAAGFSPARCVWPLALRIPERFANGCVEGSNPSASLRVCVAQWVEQSSLESPFATWFDSTQKMPCHGMSESNGCSLVFRFRAPRFPCDSGTTGALLCAAKDTAVSLPGPDAKHRAPAEKPLNSLPAAGPVKNANGSQTSTKHVRAWI